MRETAVWPIPAPMALRACPDLRPPQLLSALSSSNDRLDLTSLLFCFPSGAPRHPLPFTGSALEKPGAPRRFPTQRVCVVRQTDRARRVGRGKARGPCAPQVPCDCCSQTRACVFGAATPGPHGCGSQAHIHAPMQILPDHHRSPADLAKPPQDHLRSCQITTEPHKMGRDRETELR